MTDWLKTPQGFTRLVVLRPFFFNIPQHRKGGPGGAETITGKQRHFTKGEHFLDPKENPEDAAVLDHRWINEDFADGSIERPDATRARLEAEVQAARAVQERHAQLQRDAEIALAREQVHAEASGQVGEDLESELNTPLNQPRSRLRKPARVAPTASAADLEREMNTPINELPKVPTS